MPFKTILAVTGTDLGNSDIKLAAGLCEQIGAHLSVLIAGLAPSLPLLGVDVVSDIWLQERDRDIERLQARAAAVSKLLCDSSLSIDIASEFSEHVWANEAIGRRARYADLAVFGPAMLAGQALREKALEGLLFSSCTPLLLVPAGSTPTLRPKRVLIGWDAGVEASRAARASLELLRGAQEVHVVLIDPVEKDQGAEPGADVAAYLSRNGVRVTVDRLPSLGLPIAEVLSQHAIDRSADILVAGAYGHSRARERMFGGVTKSLLENPQLPILMAH